MSKVIFIVQQITQPRCIKRIESIIDSGHKYDVYGFNNGLYETNIERLKFKVKVLRTINKRSSKFRKIYEYIKLVYDVVKNTNKNDIIYCFGYELGVLCSFIGFRRKFIYEEADVSASRISKKLIKKFLIALDKRTIRKSVLTVFTSRGFVNYLFGEKCPFASKIIFMENRLHESFLSCDRPKPKDIDIHHITFGFIGLIRYPNTLLRFAKVIGEHFPQHKFYFWGDSEVLDFKYSELEQYKNIMFFGKFKNPDDLENIYKRIDINIACYDTRSENVRIAEPNKLYESIFFLKPLVVSSNTYLSERVSDLNSGFSIEATSDESIISFVESLNIGQINEILSSIVKIEKTEIIDDKDVLISRIKLLIP
jgi:glycosyltransferase involved in cell wall biosynthesis